MSRGTVELVLGMGILLTAGFRAQAQVQTPTQPQTESPPVWIQDVDIGSLNIDEALQSYSPWTLLADSVAKSATSRGKVQVEAHYVNPITYLHLRGGGAEGQAGREERRRDLQAIFGKYTVFYVLLKTPDDEDLVKADDWKVAVKTTVGKVLAAEKMEGGEAELVSGYKEPVYQTKLMVYFPKPGVNGKPIDVLRGDYLIASNKVHQISEEMHWVSAASSAATSNPLTKAIFKTFISLLFVVLIALCLLTRPGRDWLVKYATLEGERPQRKTNPGT